jgi:carbamate kinase
VDRLVIALGGNALMQRGEEETAKAMRASARFAAEQIAEIAARGHEVVVTHGNGPQVGRILLQNEAAREIVEPMPLDVCGAESQGQIGYLLQTTIGDVFYERDMEKPVVTVLTLTRVRPDDPAFEHPTKPVGPYYLEKDAKRFAEERGWHVAPSGEGTWRRVVASPHPYSIVEAPVIRQLVESKAIVIAAGGGGVPVVEDGPRLVGREAVVDKDLAAAILARDVGAAALIILTDVDGVYERWADKAARRKLDALGAGEARAMLDSGELGEGSMGPKVEAALNFVQAGGGRAVIAALTDAVAAADGGAGTTITA